MKAMKTVSALFGLVVLFSGLARAQDCTYIDAKKAKISVELLPLDAHVIRVRYKGAEPDRFYALTKYEKFHHTYTEFAQKKDQKSSLVLKNRKSSGMRVEHRKGGNLFTLLLNGQEAPLDCPDPSAEDQKSE
jgi:hypothetical protein